MPFDVTVYDEVIYYYKTPTGWGGALVKLQSQKSRVGGVNSNSQSEHEKSIQNLILIIDAD